jgi:signal transduction histidine kinase
LGTGPLGALFRALRAAGAQKSFEVELVPVLHPKVAATLYRIARESLTSITQHARASQVRIELGRSARGG